MTLRRMLLSVALAGFAAAAAAQDKPGEAAAEAEYRQALRSLNWVKGPTTVPLFDIASLKLPAGYLFLSREDTRKFMMLNQ